MIYIFYILITLLLIRLSYTDITHRLISNTIILHLLAMIIPFSLITHGELFFLSALVFLLFGFVLFGLGVMGAGDVKLITVLMIAIPPEQLISFFFFTACAGFFIIFFGWIFWRETIRKDGLPYGVAISLGFLTNLALFN